MSKPSVLPRSVRAQTLADAELAAILSTDYRRTRQTVQRLTSDQ